MSKFKFCKGNQFAKNNKPNRTSFKRGHKTWNKGKKLPYPIWNKGKKHTEEAKRKMSLARKGQKPWNVGKKHTQETKDKISKARKGQKPWNVGKKHTEATKEKMRLALKGRKCSEETKEKLRLVVSRGEKCNFWKGGKMKEYPELERIRKSAEYKLWHKAILERDYFTCLRCKKHGGELRVHHINNFLDFPELRLAIDNGITFCKECHKKFHKKYGQRNNTKEQLLEFYND